MIKSLKAEQKVDGVADINKISNLSMDELDEET